MTVSGFAGRNLSPYLTWHVCC